MQKKKPTTRNVQSWRRKQAEEESKVFVQRTNCKFGLFCGLYVGFGVSCVHIFANTSMLETN